MKITTDRGDVVNFVVAYEYKLRDSWMMVARFDHAQESPHGHEITEEGLHLDLFRGDRNIGLYGHRFHTSQ